MTEQEIDAALKRGEADPTLNALVEYVGTIASLILAEANGYWRHDTVVDKCRLATAEFIVAMEKASADQEG